MKVREVNTCQTYRFKLSHSERSEKSFVELYLGQQCGKLTRRLTITFQEKHNMPDVSLKPYYKFS